MHDHLKLRIVLSLQAPADRVQGAMQSLEALSATGYIQPWECSRALALDCLAATICLQVSLRPGNTIFVAQDLKPSDSVTMLLSTAANW